MEPEGYSSISNYQMEAFKSAIQAVNDNAKAMGLSVSDYLLVFEVARSHGIYTDDAVKARAKDFLAEGILLRGAGVM